jgi:hypothetical protein
MQPWANDLAVSMILERFEIDDISWISLSLILFREVFEQRLPCS